ncbi:MAG: tetratricopeptide repeat protein, partial [Acidobacteriota bacterium]
MSRTAPAAFTANNYDYLLARLSARQGNYAEANRLLQQVIRRGSVLSSYALWHQAELARRAGMLEEEQKLLEQLLARSPGFLYRHTVLQRLATNYSRAGKYQSVISTLNPIASTRGSLARESLAQVGNAQLSLGQSAVARATFESLLAGGLMDDAALRASLALDRIDETNKTAAADADRLRRARIYQFNRAFVPARKHWMALLNSNLQSINRREALFQLGRGYFLEMNFPEAIRWYQRVHDEFPTTEEGEQGFYFVGHCHQALYQVDQAIARYEQFIRAYPQSDYFGYAFLNAIDTLRVANRLEEAAKWTTRAQIEVREPFITTRALFDRVKIRMTQGGYTAALADLTTLGTRNLGLRGMVASTNSAEVSFLRTICFEQLGRFEDAVAAYLAMPEGRNDAAGYYGFQASSRLRALSRNLRSRNLLASRGEAFAKDARTAIAAGDAAGAKISASQALRLTEAAELRAEMLGILRRA